MKEKRNWALKSRFKKLAQKKWLYPALFLFVASFLISAVYWYQASNKQVPEVQQIPSDKTNPTKLEDVINQAAEPVMEQKEMIQMPVVKEDNPEIITKFFDYNASEEEQVNAVIEYNDRFYQSTGIDISNPEQDAFDVVASLSGQVSEVKEDPLNGNVVVLDHDHQIKTYYSSLADVAVQVGDEVKQGSKLGTAGKNLMGKDNGTHLHFEITKDGQRVNPESYFNQSVTKLANASFSADEEDSKSDDDDDESEEDRDEMEEQHDDDEEPDNPDDTEKTP